MKLHLPFLLVLLFARASLPRTTRGRPATQRCKPLGTQPADGSKLEMLNKHDGTRSSVEGDVVDRQQRVTLRLAAGDGELYRWSDR